MDGAGRAAEWMLACRISKDTRISHELPRLDLTKFGGIKVNVHNLLSSASLRRGHWLTREREELAGSGACSSWKRAATTYVCRPGQVAIRSIIIMISIEERNVGRARTGEMRSIIAPSVSSLRVRLDTHYLLFPEIRSTGLFGGRERTGELETMRSILM